jgi:cysteine desulfurase
VNSIIYLDNNATTRIDESVLEAMLPFLRHQFGNPASGHALGRIARDAVEQARQAVAELAGVAGGRIVFTSSATEANNLLISGLLAGIDGPCHVVTTAIEHKSVLEPLRHWEQTGRVRVTRLCPDSLGQVHPEALREALSPDTRLVSIMAASNVIHTLNPLAELAAVCASRGVLFHTDATQWAGRLPINADRWGIDAVSVSAHKLYGPKGTGALCLGRRALHAAIVPQVLGGGQESGLRSGTLNVPAIVGFGAACTLADPRLETDAAAARRLGRLLLDGLQAELPGVTHNGHPEQRIPGGVHVTLTGVDAKGLIASTPEIAFSDGSACETDREPDYVLKAIGRPQAAHHSVRFQVGRTTTEEDILAATRILVARVQRMRQFDLDMKGPFTP